MPAAGKGPHRRLTDVKTDATTGADTEHGTGAVAARVAVALRAAVAKASRVLL
jgi:hypothetical protein